jgi:hypothetical protein
MIAPHDRERALGVRPRALLNVLDPRAVDPERDLMLRLASNGARVTSDARRLIDDESVLQVRLLDLTACHTMLLV